MKKGISTLILLMLITAAFSSFAFGEVPTPEDIKALNAQLKLLYGKQKYFEAMTLAEYIRTMSEQRYGANNVETADALVDLAQIYIHHKRYDEAESILKKAVEIYKQQLGNDPYFCSATCYGLLKEIYTQTKGNAEIEQATNERWKVINMGAKVKKDKLISCGILNQICIGSACFMKKMANGMGTSAVWNAWIEDLSSANHVDVLEARKSYTFVLDMSRFSYFQGSSAEIDPSMEKLINDARKRQETKLRFTIRPIFHGNILRLAENQNPTEVLEVDIRKLLRLGNKNAEEKIQLKYGKAAEKGGSAISKFAREVQAGVVRFKVQTRMPGSAAISITIWDKDGFIPLDNLNLTVNVSDPKDLESGKTSHAIWMEDDRTESLLNVAGNFSSDGAIEADAAFYIFEPGPDFKSIILFVTRESNIGNKALNQKKKSSVRAWEWETESLISQFIEDPTQLHAMLMGARQRAQSEDENIKKYSYALAAARLRTKVFSGRPEAGSNRNITQAKEAEEVFRNLILRKKGSAIVFVRMSNRSSESVYLPLGILAAKSATPMLQSRFLLVQPLPIQRYPAAKHPVKSWTLGVPETLEGLETIPIVETLKKFKTPEGFRNYRDIDKLRDEYFKVTETAVSDPSPLGILLLAHQAGGNLWFTNMDNGIGAEDIGREFPPGSVAILSACSVGKVVGDNQAILNKLNFNGITAMIVSPFPVDMDYGTMLAYYFVETMKEVKEKTNVAKLLEEAATKTATFFEKEMSLNFEDMVLEFLIAGDYRIVVPPMGKKGVGGGTK